MKDERLKELFRKAAEISESVPKELRETAFNRALDTLLGSQKSKQVLPSPDGSAKRHIEQSQPTSQASPDSAERLLQVLDRTAYPQIGSAPRVLERSLFLLRDRKEIT